MAVKVGNAKGMPDFDPETEPTTVGVRWTKWIRGFSRFAGAEGVTDIDQLYDLLLYNTGEKVQDIWDITYPEGGDALPNENKYERLIRLLTAHFKPQINVTYERHVFRQMKQKEEENIDQFVVRLSEKAQYCEFADKNEQIRDQVIQMCKSNRVKRELLRKGTNLTLVNLREIARSVESTDEQMKQMTSSGASGGVNRVDNKPKYGQSRKFQPRPPSGARSQSSRPVTCYSCGYEGHTNKDEKCPAKGKLCNKCGNSGHFASRCKTKARQPARGKYPQKSRQNVNLAQEEPESGVFDDDDDCTFRVNSFTANTKYGEKATVRVGGVPVDMLVDSGASTNVMSLKLWEELKSKHITCKVLDVHKKLYPYGSKEALPVTDTFNAWFEIPGKKTRAQVTVVENDGEPLLCKSTAMDLGILQINLPEYANLITSSEDVKAKYPTLFDGIGKLKHRQVDIYVDPNVNPVAQTYNRPAFGRRQKIEENLKELLDNDIIEPVTGPTKWLSPIVTVPKSDGTVRICVDMKRANEAVIREKFPIPTIDEIMQDLNNGSVYSKLDLKCGYHQLELTDKAHEITTFATHKGNFRYKRLFFGPANGPEVYQKVKQETLEGCEGVNNISDDIIVHGSSYEEHDERLDKVLQRLSEKGLTLNFNKCVFRMTKLIFVGHVLSAKGVGPAEEKVKAVREFREPKDVHEVKSFMGLVNFLSEYIPDLASIAEPLWRVTRQKYQFVFGREQKVAFQEIKDHVSDAKTLAYFKLGCKTTVVADASPVGLGAVLLQEHKGQHKVISYASYSLTDVEKRYSQTEKEALGLVWACERFKLYLLGIEFDLITDHKPLEVIFSPKGKLSARIERWLLRMLPFNFNVRYAPGKGNIADPFSRLLESKPGARPSVYSTIGEEYIQFIAQGAVPRAVTVKEVKDASREDPMICELRQCIETDNWSDISDKRFLYVKNELCVIGVCVLRGSRLVIPSSLRERVVDIAHEGHMGIVKTNTESNPSPLSLQQLI